MASILFLIVSAVSVLLSLYVTGRLCYWWVDAYRLRRYARRKGRHSLRYRAPAAAAAGRPCRMPAFPEGGSSRITYDAGGCAHIALPIRDSAGGYRVMDCRVWLN